MTTTRTLTPRQATLAEVRNLVHDIETWDTETDGEPFEQVASIDTYKVVTVLLAYGGPTTGIDYRFNDEDQFTGADYWSTAYSEHSETVTIALTDDEAETLADHYAGGIENLYR